MKNKLLRCSFEFKVRTYGIHIHHSTDHSVNQNQVDKIKVPQKWKVDLF